MRLIVVMAGGFGFLTVVIGSLALERPIEMSLINGIISAFVAGILLRWWMKLWISCLEQVSRQNELSAQLDQLDRQRTGSEAGINPSEFRKP